MYELSENNHSRVTVRCHLYKILENVTKYLLGDDKLGRVGRGRTGRGQEKL